MSNSEIRTAYDEATELYEETTEGMQECAQDLCSRLGITQSKLARALGWS